MKTLYRLLFFISVFWLVLGVVITFATPYEEFVARELREKPQAWELKVTSSDFDLRENDEKVLKDMLISFLQKNPKPSKRNRDFSDSLVALVALFAFIGWMRERYLQKKNKISA